MCWWRKKRESAHQAVTNMLSRMLTSVVQGLCCPMEREGTILKHGACSQHLMPCFSRHDIWSQQLEWFCDGREKEWRHCTGIPASAAIHERILSENLHLYKRWICMTRTSRGKSALFCCRFVNKASHHSLWLELNWILILPGLVYTVSISTGRGISINLPVGSV